MKSHLHRHKTVFGAFATSTVTLVVTLAVMATPAQAQCHDFVGHQTGSSFHPQAMILDLTAQTDLLLRDISIVTRNPDGPETVEIWLNLDSPSPSNPNWYLHATAVFEFDTGLQLVPAPIDQFIPSGTNFGLCFVKTSTGSGGMIVAHDNNSVIDDGNLSLDGATSYSGNYSAAGTPPMTTIQGAGFPGEIHYELLNDPEVDVTYDGTSLGCDGFREVDLGQVPSTGPTTLTFEIHNDGASNDLMITTPFDVSTRAGTYAVGPNADYTGPAAIAPGNSEEFTVTFQPNVGLFEFTVSVHNNDANESDYPVTILGEGVAAPRLEVLLDSNVVAHGSVYNSISLTNSPFEVEIELHNAGTSVLTLGPSPIIDLDVNAGSFSAAPAVTYTGATTIDPGQSETGTIEFITDAEGLVEIDILVASDDPFADPYVVTLVVDAISSGLAVYVNGLFAPHQGSVGVGELELNTEHTFAITLEAFGQEDVTLGPAPIFTVMVQSGPVLGDPEVVYEGPLLIESGETEGAEISFEINMVEAFEILVTVENDDPARSPYEFTITGTGQTPTISAGSGGSGCAATSAAASATWWCSALALLLLVTCAVRRRTAT